MNAVMPPSFVIEISERPKYVPGSGPPLMPISLLPPGGKDWKIHSVVDVDGIPQYLVAPPNDPSVQVPVRKELILNFVSPRTYEDFEYLQAKERDGDELDEDSSILAKIMQIKERKSRTLQVKNSERSRSKQKPSNVEVQTNEHGDSDSDGEEVPARFPRAEIKRGSKKRSHSLDSHKSTIVIPSFSAEETGTQKGMINLAFGMENSPNPKRKRILTLSQNKAFLSSRELRPEDKTSIGGLESDDDSGTREEDDIERRFRGKDTSVRKDLSAEGAIFQQSRSLTYQPRKNQPSTSFKSQSDSQSRGSSSGENTRITRILPPSRLSSNKGSSHKGSSLKGSSLKESKSLSVNSINSEKKFFEERPTILPPKKSVLSQPAASFLAVNDAQVPTPQGASSSRNGSRLAPAASGEVTEGPVSLNGLQAGLQNGGENNKAERTPSEGNIMKRFGKIGSSGSHPMHVKRGRTQDNLAIPDSQAIPNGAPTSHSLRYNTLNDSRTISDNRAITEGWVVTDNRVIPDSWVITDSRAIPDSRESSVSASPARNSGDTDFLDEPLSPRSPRERNHMDEESEMGALGIVDDDIRSIDGVVGHYYLVVWNGSFVPTWVLEHEVPPAALQAYKGKLRRATLDVEEIMTESSAPGF